MASLKHAKIALGEDNPDRQVSVTPWNAEHVLTGTANYLLGFDAGGHAMDVDPSTLPLPAAATQQVTNRTALAALSTSSPVAYLRESGREGTFVWSTANHAAHVTTDTAQGVYVAPASDTTGASGAWVRVFGGDLEAHWFGIVADDATDIYAALVVAFKVTRLFGFPTTGNNNCTRGLHLRAGKYYCSQQIVPGASYFYGDGGMGRGVGVTTIIRFPVNTTGIYLDPSAPTGTTADPRQPAITLKRLSLVGPFTSYGATPEGEYHGLDAKVPFLAEDLIIDGFQGEGINIDASVSPDPLVNANAWSVVRGLFTNNRNGIKTHGSDSNAGSCVGADFESNRAFGVDDSSFLGSFWAFNSFAGNGMALGTATAPFSQCSYGGYLYNVAYGQEAGASVNPPTGAASSNTYWLYYGVGAPRGEAPAWTNGMSLRAGGSHYGGTSNSRFISNYYEGGQGAAQGGGLNYGTLSNSGASQYDYQGWTRFGNSYATTGRGIIADGNSVFNFSGSSVDLNGDAINFSATGTQPIINFSMNAGSTGYLAAHTSFSAWSHPTALHIRQGNTDLAIFDGTGLNLPTGYSFSYNGTAVISGGLLTAAASPAFTGNVTKPSGSLVTTIAAGVVTRAMMANTAAATVLGSTAAGAVAELTAAQGRTVLGLATVASSGLASDLTGTLAAAQMPALTGDVTTSAGAVATTLAANIVTYAKFQQVAASSLVGNATGSLANATGITLAADHSFSGSTLQLGAFTGDITKTAGSLATTIGTNIVTYAKFQQVAASSLVGNATGSLANATGITLAGGLAFSGSTLTAAGALTPTSVASTGAITSSSATAGVGYATGAGGAVTQLTSRTTGVTLSKTCGAITLFSAAGSTTYNTFTVTNTTVAATDVIEVSQKSGANLYNILVTAVGAGTFNLSVSAVSGTATEAPVINFAVLKAVAA